MLWLYFLWCRLPSRKQVFIQERSLTADIAWAGTRVSPVATLERKSSMTEDARVNTSAFIRAELFDGLRAEVTGSYNFRSTQARSFLPSSISNRWNTGEGYYATANRTDGRNHSYLFQTLLNYDNSFGKHTVGAMAGFSMEAKTSYSSRLAATHFPDNLVESFDMTDVDLTTAYATIGYPGRMLLSSDACNMNMTTDT